VSTYLGRLVDRAVGPPAAAVTPRLAPVFPLGRVLEAEPTTFYSESSPTPPVAPANTPEKSVFVRPSRPLRELREVHVELPAREPGEPVALIEAPTEANEQPPPREIRTHERIVEQSTIRHEVEQAEPAKARALATPRVVRGPTPVGRRTRPSVRESPRIEVRIGRVEVRRPHVPDPLERPAPAAAPSATSGGFGELAAARRYVDRGWS
jgi:hypothetical protein